MDNAYITREEHAEFVKRMDEANHRQSRRIEILEDDVRQIAELTAAVKELAVNMSNMANEQEEQGERMKVLEDRDGEKWRQAAGYAMTAIIGVVLGFIFTQIGM